MKKQPKPSPIKMPIDPKDLVLVVGGSTPHETLCKK